MQQLGNEEPLFTGDVIAFPFFLSFDDALSQKATYPMAVVPGT